MARTLDQRENNKGFVKAGEVIEIRQTSALTLHDRRVLNMLIKHAGLHIAGETTVTGHEARPRAVPIP